MGKVLTRGPQLLFGRLWSLPMQSLRLLRAGALWSRTQIFLAEFLHVREPKWKSWFGTLTQPLIPELCFPG